MKYLQFLKNNPHTAPISAFVIGVAGLIPVLQFAFEHISVVIGWEADTIARAIVSGNGFSFSGDKRWLWQFWTGDPTEYFLTAWVDPVYTYILAGMMFVFGNAAYVAMYVLTFVCIVVTLVFIYKIAKAIQGPWAGVVAVLLVSLNTNLGITYFMEINNTVLAGSMLAVLVYLTMRYIQQPTLLKLIGVGLLTGLTILTCPTVQYYLFLLPIVICAHHLQSNRGSYLVALLKGILVVGLAAVVIAPWTIRNYVVFGDFIPVRNGVGQITWDSTVGTASTFLDGVTNPAIMPPWKSDGPRDAVYQMLVTENRYAIHAHQVIVAYDNPETAFQTLNESQRDKVLLSETKRFLLTYPWISIQMTATKIEIFCLQFGLIGILTIVLTAIGILFYWRNNALWPLQLLIIAYCVPFTLIISYFERYRAPIEPLIAALAAIVLVDCIKKIYSRFVQTRQVDLSE